ncbi:MAG: hypothetical protein FJ295_12440 [Planctomycetes bacterium]|nr:hypothetical protein [Planctomycetota bacterium]
MAVAGHDSGDVRPRAGRTRPFEQDVKPLLKVRCYACHGALKQQAGLRLDTAALLLRGGDVGRRAIHSLSGISRPPTKTCRTSSDFERINRSARFPFSRLPVARAMPVRSAGVRLAMRTTSGSVALVTRCICRTI